MKTKGSDLLRELIKKIEAYKFEEKFENTGVVTQAGDGVIHIKGLSEAAYMEMLELSEGTIGLALNLEEKDIVAIILGNYDDIKVGSKVKATGHLLSVPVGKEMLGRVIDPLGRAIDGGKKLNISERYPVEKVAPGVIFRHPVDSPLQTGIKAIDSMTPIGKGQRELIIGDRQTGKTALAIDTIINQKDKDVICIYVAIGQKTSSIALTIDTLKRYDAFDHTIVVAASASDPVALQYLAPYVGCAIGEYFMDQGKDALIVYDDLTKHAWAYREISLILRRPSGREAYPGDVFYLHSRLLERACRLDKKYGGGSLTALPIIETQAGDVSTYIPTNVISITDGQIFLESDLFFAGIKPAINVGSSVSRVGGSAQTRAMKQVAGKLRLELAQYRELSAFVQFATDLDIKTKKQIDRGARMTQILKQGQYKPLSAEKQVALLWAATGGYIDDIKIKDISRFEKEYLDFLQAKFAKLLDKIAKEKSLNEEIEKQLKIAIEQFRSRFAGVKSNQQLNQ